MSRSTAITVGRRTFPVWAVAFVAAAFATRRFTVAIGPLVVFAVLVAADALATRALARSVRLRALVPAAHRATVAIGEPVELAPTYPVLDRRLDLETDGVAPYVATRSGVVTHVVSDVRVTLMGLVNRVRSVRAPLEFPLFVVPDVIRSDSMRATTPGDLTTSRRYEWGDRPSRINWAATARTGDLMVRSAGNDQDALTIVVDLSVLDRVEDPNVAEDYLGRCGGLAIAALESGREVVLVTNELSDAEISEMIAGAAVTGPAAGRMVERAVSDRDDVLVRLARSVPGDPIQIAGDAVGVPVGVVS